MTIPGRWGHEIQYGDYDIIKDLQKNAQKKQEMLLLDATCRFNTCSFQQFSQPGMAHVAVHI